MGTVQVCTLNSVMPDMLNNFTSIILSDKLRFIVPYKFKVFALIIVQ